MIKITLEEIVEKLWEIYLEKQLPLNKEDIESNGLPSYNTCMRKGLRLHKINLEFSQKFYEINPKFCKCCGSKIPYDKRINEFCGHSCSAIHNNTGRVRKTKDEDLDLKISRKKRYQVVRDDFGKPKSVLITNCVNCNIEMAELHGSKRKYCSLQCQQDFAMEQRFRDWYEFGKHFENKPIRNFLKIWKGYYCECCGISEWNGKEITLEVEHIDGNSENSKPDNVCFLCPNCHSQTDTYKAKNMGNGRHFRRLRYQEGKSY